jgi:hypothetical protein
MIYLDLYASLLLAIVFVIMYFRLGELEYGKGYLTGLASFGISFVTIFGLHGGLAALVLGHVLLFGVLWAYNMKRSR